MSVGRGRTEWRRTAAVLLCAHLVGCHSWHVETAAPATVLAERHPPQVRVTRLDGHRLVIYQPYLAGDELGGLAHHPRAGQPAGDSLRMPVAEVSGLATRRFSAGRTVLAVAGGLVGVTVLAIVIACSSNPCLEFGY
jgi:hypothetical protein